MEREASCLRSKTRLSEASANRAIAQMQKMQHELEEAVLSKTPRDLNACRADVVNESDKLALALRGTNMLPRETEVSGASHASKTSSHKQLVGDQTASYTTSFTGACPAQQKDGAHE